ncbi:hypothetical protein [Desertimonas flava]|uniref:hypothetical protein n=1 Tax=Desertimonas flava TaxID=2064846 RepID=UPI0013C49C8A|nr:hypothetical protein [Desertimonas flava]
MGQKTLRGFALGEVVSALQKAVRRGDVAQSVAWCAELDQSGFGNYAWKRLLIIMSEDIGPAWPEGPAVIAALRRSWDEYIEGAKGRKGGSERIFITHAAILLARAPKSRIVDEAIWATYGRPEPMFGEIPDEALGVFTQRGRSMGRKLGTPEGDRFWYDVESVLVNEVEFDNPFHDRYLIGEQAAFDQQGASSGGSRTEAAGSARAAAKSDDAQLFDA